MRWRQHDRDGGGPDYPGRLFLLLLSAAADGAAQHPMPVRAALVRKWLCGPRRRASALQGCSPAMAARIVWTRWGVAPNSSPRSSASPFRSAVATGTPIARRQRLTHTAPCSAKTVWEAAAIASSQESGAIPVEQLQPIGLPGAEHKDRARERVLVQVDTRKNWVVDCASTATVGQCQRLVGLSARI